MIDLSDITARTGDQLDIVTDLTDTDYVFIVRGTQTVRVAANTLVDAATAAYTEVLAGMLGDLGEETLAQVAAGIASAKVAAEAARDVAIAQGSIKYVATSGVYIAGVGNIALADIHLDGLKRVIEYRDSGNASWYYDDNGTLQAKVIQTTLPLKYSTTGVYIAGIGLGAIKVVKFSVDNRVIRYTNQSGQDFVFDALGVAQKVQVASDMITVAYPDGVYVPGMPVDAVKVTRFADKRVANAIGIDGKTYFINNKGEFYTASDGKTDYDIVIYGSSVGGLMALVRAAYRRGKRVCIIEPYTNFGGMHAAGLSFVDQSTDSAPETNIMGGDTNSIYFKWITDQDGSTSHKYQFEPKTAEIVAQRIISTYAIKALSNSPIESPRGVVMETGPLGRRIKGVWTPIGFITGTVFIDASYEGDLMAGALGPTGYTFGRESSAAPPAGTGEAYAGYLSPNLNSNIGTSFTHYTGAGSVPALGYPMIADPLETLGQADTKVQSYNFRMPLTRSSANRMPFIKPYGYDNRLYTTYLQYLRTDSGGVGFSLFCKPGAGNWGWQANLAGSKVNWNAADLVNGNVGYPDGNWTKRRQIMAEHVLWQQGLMWCVVNDPIARDYGLGPLQDDANDVAGSGVAAIGLCADEFQGSPYGAGWPFWFYPRETRRLKGLYVMTAADMTASGSGGTPTKTNSIGKWAYNWDLHSIQGFIPLNGASPYTDRFVFEGTPSNHASTTATYQIPVECMLPSASLCVNLIVPVCASFTHVAWGPQRLEIPIGFCGEAAGELAAWVCDNPSKTVQQFDYTALAARLVQYGSKL